MTVLLLGATGFLGGYLARRLSQTTRVCAPRPRAVAAPVLDGVTWLGCSLDAMDPPTIERVLDESRPDVIVNAIGITRSAGVDETELEQVNGVFPHRLATGAASRGARVVHISSDGVFSGARGGYAESDPPDPIDPYGRTKTSGELRAPHLTVRTSFFGRTPRGTGLVEWAIGQRGRTIEGFVDYRFSGLSAAILADLVAAAAVGPLEGVYHVGGEPVTKFDLLTAINERLDLGLTIEPVWRGMIDRTLDSDRFFSTMGRLRPTVAESVDTISACATLSQN